MRLADFILGNVEPILAEWESFARSIWPRGETDPLGLRDDAEEILRAAASDMASAQTATQQSHKSKGEGDAGEDSGRVNRASALHAVGRVDWGFNLGAVVAEYRALRASVIRLWRESGPEPDLRDIDDLTRFNESMDQSVAEAVRSYTQRVDRSRQMFLAIVGHDLRNPLNSMIMSAEVLAQTGEPDAGAASTAAQISSSGYVMARMINDLLDFTGTGLGAAMQLSRASMELGSLCREVFDEIRAAYPTRTLRFETQGNLTGEWDRARIRQLVSNLLGNAVQHGIASAPVDLQVGAEGNGENVLLTVHNWGPPIPRDAVATIFDPLVRGTSPEAQKKRRPGSIGLGLYIAREVAIAHGGKIDVKSSQESGTIFTVRLPRRRQTP
jgi:signal transduction histidine kinase